MPFKADLAGDLGAESGLKAAFRHAFASVSGLKSFTALGECGDLRVPLLPVLREYVPTAVQPGEAAWETYWQLKQGLSWLFQAYLRALDPR